MSASQRRAPVPDDAWELLRAAVNAQPARKTPPKAAAAKAKAKAEAGVKAAGPSGLALTWRAYGRLLAPVGWLAGAQAAGWAGWAARPLYGGQVSVLIAVLAAGWACWRASRNALWAGQPGGAKGRPRRVRGAGGVKSPPWALSRGYLAWCAGAGTLWVLWAVQAGAGGRWVQAAWLAGGLGLAVPHWHRRRVRDVPRLAPAAVTAAAGEEPRLARFRELFCTGPLDGAELGGFTEVPDGFAFEMALAATSKGTRAAVVALRPQIAARWDVPEEQVSVEQSKVRKSEARARVTVLETAGALERVRPWDGISTYDPAAGTVDLGHFIDSQTARWQLHKPGSGATGGLIAGMLGHGKTGTAHCLACEMGLAKMCVACAAAGTCDVCAPERICAVWMGDPQMQPFGVWRGRADLMAWGPEACVVMLLWAVQVMRARAAFFGKMRWADHLGRENTGKGWFDPGQFKLIQVIIDEWPLVVGLPVWGKAAVRLAGILVREGRKVGMGVNFMTQIPDLSELGERAIRELLKAFNALSHRTDGLSKYMMGIQGDPSGLPSGVHGLGFLNGVDGRPAATMRVKHLPEYLEPGDPPGPDVRGLAELIAGDPVTFGGDEAVLAELDRHGWSGPGMVLDSEQIAPLMDRLVNDALAGIFADAPDAGPQGPAAPAAAAAGGVPLVAGPASLDAVSRVARAISNGPAAGAELYDLMAATGLDALQVQRAASALVASGHARQAGNAFVPA